jgi:TM2 domain-containing membrane protein YozV
MRKIATYLTILITLTLGVVSCTIQKRHYRNGYHLELSKQIHNKTQALEPESISNSATEPQQTNELVTSVHEDGQPKFETVVVVANEIAETSNHEMVESVKVHTYNVRNITEVRPTAFGKAATKAKPTPPDGENTTNKSQLVALLLCFFFGVLGIHRFYLGYIGIGLIQLFTAGGCGIWALIDLILIITGDLKPKNGEYGSKF